MQHLSAKVQKQLREKEFPARGSVICHLATDHAFLLEAMRNDDEVDMQSVSVFLIGRADSLRCFNVANATVCISVNI